MRFFYAIQILNETLSQWEGWLTDERLLTKKGKEYYKNHIDELEEAIKILKEAK